MKRPFLLTITLTLILLSVPTFASDKPSQLFLKTHCSRCHGAEKQKSERRFDTLPKTIASSDDLERYQEILDQLNLQSMPPEDEPQPSNAERLAVVESLTKEITEARPSADP